MNIAGMGIVGGLSALRCASAGFVLLSFIGPVPIVAAQDQPGGASEPNPTPAKTRCEAIATVEYEQRNTIARVEGSIENGSCVASSGEYTIAIIVRDEKGESNTLEFSETWQRADDQPVKFLSDYEIGEGVELVRVRSRRLTCICAGPPGD